MPIRTEDYRPYGKEYRGRSYRIFRIFTNSSSSLLSNKWAIIVMAFSFLFLFFSILEIVFTAPAEEIQIDIGDVDLEDVYFDIIPLTPDDLEVVTPLNSTFKVSYRVTNVGANASAPFFFVMLPNSHWDADWDMGLQELGPGESMVLEVTVRVPGSKRNFSYIPETEMTDDGEDGEDPDDLPKPRMVQQSLDPGLQEILDSLISMGLDGFDLGTTTSPYSIFPNAGIFRTDVSRLMLTAVIPGDVALESLLNGSGSLMDPRIASVATLISIDPSDSDLSSTALQKVTDTEFELEFRSADGSPLRWEMTSQSRREFVVDVRNTGNETIDVRIEALVLPLSDSAWYVDIWSDRDFDIEPDWDIEPGEEVRYEVYVGSGNLQLEMPYNIILIATDWKHPDHPQSRAEHLVINVTGPPREETIQEKIYRTFWGGGFNYERFLWIILLTAVCGSGLIANDLNNNTLSLYLSRPITWFDYTVGKFLALSTVLSLITIIPAILIFITRMAFVNEPFTYVLEHLWLLGGMLLAYLVVILMFSSIATAMSSMTRRGIFAGVGIFGYFLITPIVSDLMVEIFETDSIKLLNINLMMKNLIKPLYGVSYNADSMGFGYGLVLLVCSIIVAACWIYVFFRFNKREVAK
ncbi:MAG: ABC transporter permease [Thermoplasmatota archaeon]